MKLHVVVAVLVVVVVVVVVVAVDHMNRWLAGKKHRVLWNIFHDQAWTGAGLLFADVWSSVEQCCCKPVVKNNTSWTQRNSLFNRQ